MKASSATRRAILSGQLPDLDMPIRQDELDDDDGGRDLKWRGFQLAKAADWQAFHQAFLKLYRKQVDRELLAVFTAIENRRIVVLPPEAAALVAKELPSYPLGPCARPPGSALSLELGHSLQLDHLVRRVGRRAAEATRRGQDVSREDRSGGRLFRRCLGHCTPGGLTTGETLHIDGGQRLI